MKVFISWSKESSKLVAEALQEWLPDVIHDVDTFVSSASIDAGARWYDELQKALEQSHIGILCVTVENQSEPWLVFEAGALAKKLDKTYVCPYLIGMAPQQLRDGPLKQFQAKAATKEGTLELVLMVNNALGSPVPRDRVKKLFEKFWPDLEVKLQTVPSAASSHSQSGGDMALAEMPSSLRKVENHLLRIEQEVLPMISQQISQQLDKHLSRLAERIGPSAPPVVPSAIEQRLPNQQPAAAAAPASAQSPSGLATDGDKDCFADFASDAPDALEALEKPDVDPLKKAAAQADSFKKTPPTVPVAVAPVLSRPLLRPPRPPTRGPAPIPRPSGSSPGVPGPAPRPPSMIPTYRGPIDPRRDRLERRPVPPPVVPAKKPEGGE